MTISCGYCNHPGVHAGVMPADARGRTRCNDCAVCQAQLAIQRSEQEAQMSQRTAVPSTKPVCDGCGEATTWNATDETWALVEVQPGGNINFQSGLGVALPVRAVGCQRCGYLRFYDAKFYGGV